MFRRSSEAKNKRYWSEYNSDYFGWDSNHRINVLNSFIVGKKGNIVIHTCLDLLLNFWKTQIIFLITFSNFFDVLINDLRSTIYDCQMILFYPIYCNLKPIIFMIRLNLIKFLA